MAVNTAITQLRTDSVGRLNAATPHFRPRASQLADPAQSLQPLRCVELAQNLLQNRWLARPAAGALQRLAYTAYEAAGRQAARQAAAVASGKERQPLEPADAAELSTIRQQCDLVNAQVCLLDLLVRQIKILDDLAARLINQRFVAYGDLVPLSHRIIEFAWRARSPCEVVPWSVLDVGELVGSAVETGHAPLHTGALLAALQVAWLLKDRECCEHRLLATVLAAAVQDVGLIALQPHLRAAEGQPGQLCQLAEQHPAMGAALLGGIAGAPPSLARTVARHHERIDGRGFPRRLPGDLLPRSVRLLGIVNRLQTLRQEAVQSGENAPIACAVRWLANEAQQGLWDENLAQFACAQFTGDAAAFELLIRPVIEPPGELEVAADQRPTDEELAGRSLEWHMREPQLKGGHHERNVAAGTQRARG